MANSMQNVVVGKRQILRQIKSGNICKIIIATDAQRDYVIYLMQVAKDNGIPYVLQGTMSQIANQYGIDVPSGSVGVLKQNQV